MKIMLTGGFGYKGRVLLPKLLRDGHDVTVYDTCWFSEVRDVNYVRGDIRDLKTLPKVDCIIHLANIANDPCGELDAKLTWEVNALGTVLLADKAVRAGIPRFIYASSASVYGIKGNEPVVEDTPLEPVSDYNKTKMVAERVLLSYSHLMGVQIVRPATVCGYSPRMRLDVIVNMLTMQALTKGEIIAHCGEHGAGLMRPHTHIEDATDLYVWMLDHPLVTGVFNAGFENLSVMEVAERIRARIPAKLTVTPVVDKRSYRVDSSKLLATGFRPKRTVNDAIDDIVVNYSAGVLKDEPRCYNLAWMKEHGWVAA